MREEKSENNGERKREKKKIQKNKKRSSKEHLWIHVNAVLKVPYAQCGRWKMWKTNDAEKR